MRIVFAGTPEFAVPTLRALADAGHEIAGVITREDAPLGRKRVLTASPVAAAANDLGVPTLRANRLTQDATDWVAGLGHDGADSAASPVDLGVIVAYGGLVREPLLSLPKLGWINLHFSALPRWRGAAPVQRALQAGEQRLGVTVFRLVEALDAGRILTSDAADFPEGSSAGRVLRELAELGTGTVERAIAELERDPDAGAPQQGEASYAPKLTREDGKLDPGAETGTFLAHWAGVTPEPGAYVMHESAPLKVLDVRRIGAGARADAGVDTGAGSVTLEAGAAILHLRDGAIELAHVQPAGKAAMDGAAWLRGRGGEAVLS